MDEIRSPGEMLTDEELFRLEREESLRSLDGLCPPPETEDPACCFMEAGAGAAELPAQPEPGDTGVALTARGDDRPAPSETQSAADCLLSAAEALSVEAQAGEFTRSAYESRKAWLLGQATPEETPALEEKFRALEGDRNNPYGGYCFRSEGTALCVEISPRGTRKLVPLLLAQTVQRLNSIVNFRLDSGEFSRYYYRGGVYLPCPDERLRERLVSELIKEDETLYRYAAVNEAANTLAHMEPVGSVELLDADENVVNLKNGLLRLDTLQREFHTPKRYSTVQLNALWTEKDAPTPNFDRLLAGICGGDKEKQALLLKFMGLCLTNVPGWRLKKSLFLYGPGNTGKSVLRRFIERILGQGNYMNVDLQTMEEDKFAAAQLQGKRLAGASDMGFMKVRQLALFKQLTGGDNVYAQQKGQKPFTFRYRGFLWFCMNEPPLFGGDRGDWVYDRMILFPCGDPVPEQKRDPKLSEKLWAERDAVVRRLILAAKTVIDADYKLEIPDVLEAGKAAYRQENDPAEKFFMTCCRIRPTPEISPLDESTCKNVFEVFRNWCADNAPGYLPKKSDFRKTCARLLNLPEEEIVVRTKKTTFYIFTLTEETLNEYGKDFIIRKTI